MKSRAGFWNALITASVFLALEIISIVLITHNSVVQRYKILAVTKGVQTFFWRGSENFRGYVNLRSENDRLQRENAELKQRVAYYEDLDFQTRTDSLKANFKGVHNYIAASVVKNSTNKQHNYILINRGRRDGVETGMGVITSEGVVGIVNAVSERYAYVISFMNTSQAVSAKLLSKEYFGPMYWDGIHYNRAVVRELPLYCEAAVGDTIATSGYSTIFPPDLSIGTVREVKEVGGMSINLDVELFMDFKKLKTVYVVDNQDRDEIEKLSSMHPKTDKKK